MLPPPFLPRDTSTPQAIYSARDAAQKVRSLQRSAAMDPVSLTYYAIVCGCLAVAVAAAQSAGVVRIIVGVAVGLSPALLLPVLRRATGL